MHTNKCKDLEIYNVNIVDVENGTIQPGQTVTIANGLIKSIKKSKRKISSNQIDGTDKYVMPGLIDAHMHLFQSGGLYTRPDMVDLQDIVPYDEERQWLSEKTEEILNRYLSQGITSVIDLGGPMYNLMIKDSINQMENTAHVYLTGPLISTYLPKELDVDSPPIIKVSDEENAKVLVRKQMEFDPDFIKIWFVILKPQDALDNYPLVKAIIDEAKLHQKPVAVHATELLTAKIALELGADFLVHSVSELEIDDEFLTLLKSSNAVYCPTMQVSSNSSDVFYGDYENTKFDYEIALPKALGSLMDVKHLTDSKDLYYYDLFKEKDSKRQSKKDKISLINLRKIQDAGVPVALGTDAGNIGTMHASSYFREIELFKSAGMSNQEIVKSATLNAARAIQKEDEIGLIDVNKKADLLLLNSDPFQSLDNLRDINLVVKNGIGIQTENLIQSTTEDIVQKQLNAFNGHDLDEFMTLFADDVKIYNYPNQYFLEGKEIMRQEYGFVEKVPDLYAELLSRKVLGQTVIDHTRLTYNASRPPSEVITIYTISDGMISTVHIVK